MPASLSAFFFFFNDTATTEIYTLSLHDALPISVVERARRRGDAWVYDLRVPRDVREIAIPHGSITLDGVSLTINALPGPDVVQVALIPFTREHTTLGTLRVGDRVHVEGDTLGRYVRQLCRTAP